MTFSTQLNYYMEALNCSASKLSRLTGVPPYTISKYRSGNRRPNKDGKIIQRLADGLHAIAMEQNIQPIQNENIATSLNHALRSETERFDYDALIRNLHLIMKGFGITITELAEDTHYHRSTLYAMWRGKTKLRDPDAFVEKVAQYIVKRFGGIYGQMKAADLIGLEKQLFDTKADYREALALWLSGKIDTNQVFSDNDIPIIQEFDLNVYHRSIKYAGSQISESSAHFTKMQDYVGMKGLETAVSDFIKTSSSSKSFRDVILYGNFPIEHMLMAANSPTHCTEGLTAALQKGTKIISVHNLDRSIDEIAAEVNFWLPLLMSGQVHLKYVEEPIGFFHNLFFASSGAVLRGMCVKENYNSAHFQLFTDPHGIEREYHFAEMIAAKSAPLAEAFTRSERDEFVEILAHESLLSCQRDEYLSAPPIYTISEALLAQILKRSRISAAQDQLIRAYVQKEKDRIGRMIADNELFVRLTHFSSREFNSYPVRLNLSGGLLGIELFYTFEEYMQHILETKAYERANRNYHLLLNGNGNLRNIQITIAGNSSALISKNTLPEMHFLIRKTRWVCAISEMCNRSFQGNMSQ